MPAIAANIIPTKTITIAPITEDERASVMERLNPLLDRFARNVARVPRPDLIDVSERLLGAHAHAITTPYAERFARLPSDDFDAALIPALRTFAVACRLVAAALASNDDATASRAKLPVDLVQEATALKVRMLRYLDYQLAHDAVAKRETDGIREGTGYLDLESDLRRLAVLADANQSLLVGDRTYRASDASDAERLADAITRELASVKPTPTPWVDRLWAAIRTVYADNVRPTAEWLFRETPSELAHYPSIYVGFGRPRGSQVEPAPVVADTPLAPVTPDNPTV